MAQWFDARFRAKMSQWPNPFVERTPTGDPVSAFHVKP
jgi:hypothetical protein